MTHDGKHLVGYGRVSTLDQNPDMQRDALIKFGVRRSAIHIEKASGKNMDRPVLTKLIKTMPPNSAIVVWRLDRLGRTMIGLCETVKIFEDRGIDLIVIKENIDTTTATGRLMFHVSAAFAEFERNVIAERTAEGMKRKMATGWKPGRRAIIPNSPKIMAEFQALYDSGRFASMTNKQVYEAMQAADPKNKFTMRTYVLWKHKGHPGAALEKEAPLKLDD